MRRAFRIGILPFLLSQALAVPTGVWIQDGEDRIGTRNRLEVRGENEAFRWHWGTVSAVEIKEEQGILRVMEGGKALWALAPDGKGGWIDRKGSLWKKREDLLKIDPAWTEVTIHLTDQFGPVPAGFGVNFWIEDESGSWDPLLVTPLVARQGTVVIKAPADGEIRLEPEHVDFIRGYHSGRKVLRASGAKDLTAEFERGQTISGKVVDAATGKPVAGAKVFPMMFTPPSFSPDLGRSVVTDGEGIFKLRGVSRSIEVQHPDFVDEEVSTRYEKPVDNLWKVSMERGESIRGRVTDPSGRPLPDVEMSDGTGKKTVTDAEGRFELRGLRKWAGDHWSLGFSKEGFGDVRWKSEQIDPDGLKITMSPLPVFKVRVVDGNGVPVTKYRLVSGPGPAPESYQCKSTEVAAADGRFSFQPDRLPEDGRDFWIGVRASGHAPWDGVVAMSTLREGNFEVRLEPGRTLSGSVVLPASATGLASAELIPTQMENDSPRKELGSSKGTFKPGEALRFADLRPGSYELRIYCEGAAPLIRPVTIAGSDLDLGELRLGGSGTVFGTLQDPYDPGKPWRFADGEIRLEGLEEPLLEFKTDKDGKFRVRSVPAGKVEIVFHYNLSADMIDAKVAEVTVPEGGEVEAKIRD